MTETLFLKLYDSLSRRLAHETRCVNLDQCLRLVPDALQSNRVPVILCETAQKTSASITAYYPLSEQAYRVALSGISLARFNLCNTYSNKQRVFGCGLDWWDGVGYLHATVDLPCMPKEPRLAYHDLYHLFDELASRLDLDLVPVTVTLNRHRPVPPDNPQRRDHA